MCKFSNIWGPIQLLVCLMLVALAPLAQANIISINNTTQPPDLLTPGSSSTILATKSGVIITPAFTTDFTTSVI